MRKGISEILAENEKITARKDKIEHLQEHRTKVLLDIFRCAFDDSIKFLLPPGDVPYTKNLDADPWGALYSEARRLYLFVEGGHPNLKPMKREMLYIQFLEMLHPKDAELMVAVKDKKLPYKGITKKLVQEAFPGLINE